MDILHLNRKEFMHCIAQRYTNLRAHIHQRKRGGAWKGGGAIAGWFIESTPSNTFFSTYHTIPQEWM